MYRPAKPDTPDHAPCSNGVDPDSAQLTDYNDPGMHDSTTVFENLVIGKWIHAELNLPQGELLRKAKLLSYIKMEMVKSRSHVTLIPLLIL